jgi:hypothetical protein
LNRGYVFLAIALISLCVSAIGQEYPAEFLCQNCQQLYDSTNYTYYIFPTQTLPENDVKIEPIWSLSDAGVSIEFPELFFINVSYAGVGIPINIGSRFIYKYYSNILGGPIITSTPEDVHPGWQMKWFDCRRFLTREPTGHYSGAINEFHLDVDTDFSNAVTISPSNAVLIIISKSENTEVPYYDVAIWSQKAQALKKFGFFEDAKIYERRAQLLDPSYEANYISKESPESVRMSNSISQPLQKQQWHQSQQKSGCIALPLQSQYEPIPALYANSGYYGETPLQIYLNGGVTLAGGRTVICDIAGHCSICPAGVASSF